MAKKELPKKKAKVTKKAVKAKKVENEESSSEEEDESSSEEEDNSSEEDVAPQTNRMRTRSFDSTEAKKAATKTKKRKAESSSESEEESDEEDGVNPTKKAKLEVDENGNRLVTTFRICPSTMKALEERGIKSLFKIQTETFDHIYDGKDLIGRARTGLN